jgi:hypothetical protein
MPMLLLQLIAYYYYEVYTPNHVQHVLPVLSLLYAMLFTLLVMLPILIDFPALPVVKLNSALAMLLRFAVLLNQCSFSTLIVLSVLLIPVVSLRPALMLTFPLS